MKCRTVFLGALLLLAGCATTTLYTGHFEAPNSAGQNREYVLYWNSTASVFSGTKTSPVTLLTQCSSRTIQYEEQPVTETAHSPTQIVFRGEPGFDTAVGSTLLPPSGVCGRVLSADRLRDLRGPRIEFTVSCKPVSGNPFAALDDNYLQARDTAYVVGITATNTKDLAAATPHRPSCPVHH